MFKFGVLFAEAVNTARSIQKALLAGEKGMAVGANFHMHLLALGGEHFFFMPAGAGDGGVVHFGMDVFFHDSFSL